MKYGYIPHTDLKVSKICLGTMTWGDRNSEAEAFAQLDYALAAGVNFIDTAEVYPVPPTAATYGRTETFIGNWLAARRCRDQVVLASKVAGKGVSYIRDGVGLKRDSIRQALDGSLRRLQTDYLDLYQLHWPQRSAPVFGVFSYDPKWVKEADGIAEALETLGEAVTAGKVRHIGLSNETQWGVMKYLKVALANPALPRVVTVQNAYHLTNRKDEIGLVEVLLREGVGYLPYSPMGGGSLSGKYFNGTSTPEDRFNSWGKARSPRFVNSGVAAAVKSYSEIARQEGISMATLALAFVNRQAFCSATIIGATNLSQLKEDIASVDVALSTAAVAAIDAIHYSNPNPSESNSPSAR